MAELIPQGGHAEPPHPVTGDPGHPRALFTRSWVRSLLGLAPEDELSAYPVKNESGEPDGFVFVQKPAAAHGAKRLANLRASFLCGWLVFGPAVRTTLADAIEWKPGA